MVGTILGWSIVSMVVLIPLGNLVVKAGWVASMENEQARRGWSPLVMFDSIVQSKSFSNEILWSIQLGLYSSIAAIILGALLVQCTKKPWMAWFSIAW